MHASKLRTFAAAAATGHDCLASRRHVYAPRAQEVGTRAALDRVLVVAAEETVVSASFAGFYSSFSG